MKTGVHRIGAKFSTDVQQFLYTDDIDIIGRTTRDVTADFNAIESNFADMGLVMNEAK